MSLPTAHSQSWNKFFDSIFSEYNQKDATFLNLFTSVKRSTCFGRVFRPSTRAQNCTYSVRYLSDQYLTRYVQFWAPDDGWKTRLKHVERLTEINELRNVASCWLYSENILAMHGYMNVKFFESIYFHLSDRKVTAIVDTPAHNETECSDFDCNVTVHIV